MRDQFNALIDVPTWAAKLIDDAETAGTFTRGIETDRKGRGEAINVDLFGHDSERGLIVIQVRQATLHPTRYTRVRKDYYMVGRNENGRVFSHPVDSPARSKKAMSSPEASVIYVLAKIWECKEGDLDEIVRQGDVAFVPVRSVPPEAEKLATEHVMIRDTHLLKGDIWQAGEIFYVRRGANMRHTKRQHAAIKARYGYYRVQPGVRADTWGFTAPQGD